MSMCRYLAEPKDTKNSLLLRDVEVHLYHRAGECLPNLSAGMRGVRSESAGKREAA